MSDPKKLLWYNDVNVVLKDAPARLRKEFIGLIKEYTKTSNSSKTNETFLAHLHGKLSGYVNSYVASGWFICKEIEALGIRNILPKLDLVNPQFYQSDLSSVQNTNDDHASTLGIASINAKARGATQYIIDTYRETGVYLSGVYVKYIGPTVSYITIKLQDGTYMVVNCAKSLYQKIVDFGKWVIDTIVDGIRSGFNYTSGWVKANGWIN
jgi:hypothetical protein